MQEKVDCKINPNVIRIKKAAPKECVCGKHH